MEKYGKTIIKRFDTKEEWLEFREGKMGGTATVVSTGISKWTSKLKLWNIMTGREDGIVEENEAMRMGTFFEPGFIAMLCDDIGAERQDIPGDWWIAEREGLDRMFTTPDSLILVNGELCTVEAKKTRMAITEPTDSFITQSNWHCGMMELKTHYVVMYVSSIDQVIYRRYEFDEDLFEQCVIANNEFLELVDKDVPPPPQTDEDFTDYTKSNGKAIEGNDVVMNAINRLKELKDLEKITKAEKSEIELAVKSYIGDNEVLELGGLKYATFKSTTRKTFDGKKFKVDDPDTYEKYVKESDSRSLRVNWKLF